MDRGSKSELLKTIESQREKIQKYESKLRDLILAYKGVSKEKEALEASIKALSAAQPPSSSARGAKAPRGGPREGEQEDPGDGEDEGDGSHQEEGEGGTTERRSRTGSAGEDSAETSQLRAQLATLTTALMTLTQEKSKLETNFLNDKRKMRVEIEEVTESLDAEQRRNEELVHQMSTDLQEWKNKLRTQQREREKEHNDHAMMLRELQKLLAEERGAKEQVEHQMDELRQELLDTSQRVVTNNDQNDKVVSDLLRDAELLREELRAAERRSREPTPEHVQLQKEVHELRTQHEISLHQEHIRSSEVERLMTNKAHDSEHRVSELEAKVAELSEATGNYERMRYQDQQAITKLKDKICQLDMENTALAQSTHRRGGTDQETFGLDDVSDIQAILSKMLKLKDILKTANERSEKPVDLDELLQGGLGAVDPETLHVKCQEDLDHLREEFERYKLRAQSVLKSKSSKDPSPHLELEGLRSQVAELKDRLFTLRMEYEDQGQLLRTKEETFRNSIQRLTEKHTKEFTDQAAEYKHSMGEQELEIRRHRERTIALLSEKDRELEKLRMRLPDHLEAQYITTYRQMSTGSDPSLGEIGASSEEQSAVSELLTRGGIQGSPAESTILHFAQEQARKEVEVQNLRKQKHSLEMAMRELQQNSILKEQRYLEQIDLLKEEVRKYERNISRESANLEYLKNVVYHFMLSTDRMAKQGTLNAISLILQFSPREKDRVQKELDRGWFSYVNQVPKTQV